MKKGKVKVLNLSAKNKNHIFTAGDDVTENDVENFDLLVKDGYIQPDKKYDKELEKLEKAEKDARDALKKAELKHEGFKTDFNAKQVAIDNEKTNAEDLKKKIDAVGKSLEKAADNKKPALQKQLEDNTKLLETATGNIQELEKEVGPLEKEYDDSYAKVTETKKDLEKAIKELSKYR